MHRDITNLVHALSRTGSGRKLGSSSAEHFAESPFPNREGDIAFVSDPSKDRQIIKQLKGRLHKKDIRIVVVRAMRWPSKKNAHATLRHNGGNLVASRGYYHVYSFSTFHTHSNLEKRIHGLESLLDECDGMRVKSIGCAEGLVLNQFRLRGAQCFGCDIRNDAVVIARHWCPESQFRCCDAQQGCVVIGDTEITLALGVLHKMEESESKKVVDSIVNTTSGYIAIRGPYPSTSLLHDNFATMHSIESPDDKTGKLTILRRKVLQT